MFSRDALDAFVYLSEILSERKGFDNMAEKHIDISFVENEKENTERPLKGVILFEEDGRHWLRLHYKKENGDDLYIPKLALPIDQIPMIEDIRLHEKTFANWPYISLEMEASEITVRDDLGNPVKCPGPTTYVVVKNRKKMTRVEIEKELGYPIEIVDED